MKNITRLAAIKVIASSLAEPSNNDISYTKVISTIVGLYSVAISVLMI